MASEEKKHIWNFYRYGGIDQVELATAEDLTKLNELDPKLWAAMTCPVSNVDFDQQTLTYLDTDGDKRIKIPEIIAGVNWISSILKDPASIKNPEEDLPLDKINENSEEGKALLSTAKQVLFNLGKEDAKSIVVELRVAPSDMGKVIGKQGRIAKAIRAVVKAAASKIDKKVIVDIIDVA